MGQVSPTLEFQSFVRAADGDCGVGDWWEVTDASKCAGVGIYRTTQARMQTRESMVFPMCVAQ